MKITVNDVYTWLQGVKDPEIPVLSVVDLGVISKIDISGDEVKVTITPTFVGCPAIDLMKEEITQALLTKGINKAAVDISYNPPWSSDLISDRGKEALKNFGLAPPSPAALIDDLEILGNVSCPRCNNANTELKTPFGSTLCRAIHYCYSCKESFEQFKPL